MKGLVDAQLQTLIFSFVLWSNPFNALAKSRPWFCFMVLEEWETISCQNTQRALLPTWQGFRPVTILSHPEISIDWRRPAQSERAQFRCLSFSEFGDMMTWQKLKEVVTVRERETSWIIVIVILVNVGDTQTATCWRKARIEQSFRYRKLLDEVFSRYGSVKQIRVDEASLWFSMHVCHSLLQFQSEADLVLHERCGDLIFNS